MKKKKKRKKKKKKEILSLSQNWLGKQTLDLQSTTTDYITPQTAAIDRYYCMNILIV